MSLLLVDYTRIYRMKLFALNRFDDVVCHHSIFAIIGYWTDLWLNWFSISSLVNILVGSKRLNFEPQLPAKACFLATCATLKTRWRGFDCIAWGHLVADDLRLSNRQPSHRLGERSRRTTAGNDITQLTDVGSSLFACPPADFLS